VNTKNHTSLWCSDIFYKRLEFNKSFDIDFVKVEMFCLYLSTTKMR